MTMTLYSASSLSLSVNCSWPVSLAVSVTETDSVTVLAACENSNYIVKYAGLPEPSPSRSPTLFTDSNVTCYNPYSLWPDTSGNVFAACYGSNYILKYSASFYGPVYTSLPSSPVTCSSPAGVWVDPNGNVFAACSNSNNVVKYSGASYSPSSLPSNVTCSNPSSVWGDISGNNIFASCAGSNYVVKFTGVSYSATSLPTSVACSHPYSVWGDTSGNVFAACYGSNRIVKYSGVSYNPTLLPMTVTCANPRSVWVDTFGNIFAACYGSNYIVKYAAGSHSPTSLPTTVTCSNPSSVRGDASGNVFAACATSNYIVKYAATCPVVAPSNGTLGSCSSLLPVGSPPCSFTCDDGYSLSGTNTSCSTTARLAPILSAQTCKANPHCSLISPLNGGFGSCSAFLVAGRSCSFTCNVNFTLSAAVTTCSNASIISPQACIPMCSIVAPLNGVLGSCSTYLSPGSMCSFVCNAGYTISALNTTCSKSAVLQQQTCDRIILAESLGLPQSLDILSLSLDIVSIAVYTIFYRFSYLLLTCSDVPLRGNEAFLFSCRGTPFDQTCLGSCAPNFVGFAMARCTNTGWTDIGGCSPSTQPTNTSVITSDCFLSPPSSSVVSLFCQLPSASGSLCTGTCLAPYTGTAVSQCFKGEWTTPTGCVTVKNVHSNALLSVYPLTYFNVSFLSSDQLIFTYGDPRLYSCHLGVYLVPSSPSASISDSVIEEPPFPFNCGATLTLITPAAPGCVSISRSLASCCSPSDGYAPVCINNETTPNSVTFTYPLLPASPPFVLLSFTLLTQITVVCTPAVVVTPVDVNYKMLSTARVVMQVTEGCVYSNTIDALLNMQGVKQMTLTGSVPSGQNNTITQWGRFGSSICNLDLTKSALTGPLPPVPLVSIGVCSSFSITLKGNTFLDTRLIIDCDDLVANFGDARVNSDFTVVCIAQVCPDGLYSDPDVHSQCLKCPSFNTSLIYVFILVTIIFLCLFIVLNRLPMFRALRAPIQISFTYFQVLSLLSTMQFHWPQSVRTGLNAFTVFGLNVSAFASASCWVPPFYEFLLAAIFPLVVVCVLSFGYLMLCLNLYRDGDNIANMKVLAAQVFRDICSMLVSLWSITSNIITYELFKAARGLQVIQVSPWILVAYGIVYIGIPPVLFLLMITYPDHRLFKYLFGSSGQVCEVTQSLTVSLRPGVKLWELTVVVGWKILFNAVVVFADQNTQIGVLSCFFVVLLFAHLIIKPYSQQNELHIFMIAGSLIVLFSGLAFYLDSDIDVQVIFAIIVYVTVIAMIIMLIVELRNAYVQYRRKEDVGNNNDIKNSEAKAAQAHCQVQLTSSKSKSTSKLRRKRFHSADISRVTAEGRVRLGSEPADTNPFPNNTDK